MKAKYLYCLRMKGTDRYKVGISTRPQKRKEHVKHLVGGDLELVWKAPTWDAFAVEKEAHAALSEFAISGEWFCFPEDQLYAVLSTLKGCTVRGEEAAKKLRESVRRSHHQRKQRRLDMAKAVRDGEDPTAVAARYAVTIKTVQRGCREAGVEWPKAGHKTAKRSTYDVLAALVLTDDDYATIAERLGKTVQAVKLVKFRAADAGIPLHPSRSRSRKRRREVSK